MPFTRPMEYRAAAWLNRLGDVLIPAAIVGALTLVLAPVLRTPASSARDRQMQSTCSNNLRHIGQAMAAYLADNNNAFPAWSYYASGSPYISVEDYTTTQENQNTGSLSIDTRRANFADAAISTQLTNYLPRTRANWSCPADFGPFTSLSDWVTTSRPFKDWRLIGRTQTVDVSYGYRGTNLSSGGTPLLSFRDPNGRALAGYRLSDVKSPARCAMFWEHRPWHFMRPEASSAEYSAARYNVLCVDGHVVSPTTSQASNPSNPYAFFGDIRQ